MKVDVIICAAGQGKRMGLGKNKLFLEIEGIPVLIHTLRIWEEIESVRHVFVVIHQRDEESVKEWIEQFGLQKVKKLVYGGVERQDSVYNGLAEINRLADKSDMVLIHDGARPFVKKEEIMEIIAKTKEKKATVLAVPVKDTIKKVYSSNEIIETLDRSVLWAVQTPQAFDLDLLNKAYQAGKEAGVKATDDASLVERLGQTVYVVPGGYHNIKLTAPEDILLAEYLLQRSREQ